MGRYGAFVVERTGTDIDEALTNLQPWKDNIYVIAVGTYNLRFQNNADNNQQLIQNDISSTKIRLFLRREMSVQYLIPAPVIEYIEANGLYEEENVDSKAKVKEEMPGTVAGSSSKS